MVSDSDEAFRNQSLRVKEPRARKFFFENLLTNSSLCGIILSVNGTNRLLGICVMAAQQTLTLYVGVRISHPQPMKRAGKSSVYADFRLLIFLMTDLLQGLCKGFSGAFCRQGVVRCVGFI